MARKRYTMEQIIGFLGPRVMAAADRLQSCRIRSRLVAGYALTAAWLREAVASS